MEVTEERLKLQKCIEEVAQASQIDDTRSHVSDGVASYLGNRLEYWTDSTLGAVYALIHNDRDKFKYCFKAASTYQFSSERSQIRKKYLTDLVKKVFPNEWIFWLS